MHAAAAAAAARDRRSLFIAYRFVIAVRRLEMPSPAIGYVTSGQYSPFGTKFEAGLTTTGAPWVVGTNVDIKKGEANGDYDSKNLRQTLSRHIVRLSNDPDVKLIVAAGGLVSAFAAAKHSTKPFLVVIGQLPAIDDFDLDPDSSFNFCGGINLDTTGTNAARLAFIKPSGAQPQDVFLAFNKNARMAKAEQRAFKAIGGSSIAICADADGDNDVDDFDKGFKKAKNKKNAKAFVISADPFFAHNRSDLVKAANTVSLPVCYPSIFYKQSSGNNPVSGRDKYYGPDLEDVYKQLGIKAGNLLTKLTSGTMLPEFMGLDSVTSSSGTF